MIRFLYNLLWPIGLVFYLPAQLVKMVRRGGYRRNFGQRLAIYRAAVRRRLRDTHPIWLHAVSVGEVGLALKLARQLQDKKVPLVLTTTTTTGYALAERSAPASVQVLYSPLDFWPVMRRAFRRIQPRLLVLIEAEVWPNLVSFASRRAVPIILANARLSPRSERRFRRFKFFVAPIFRKLDLVCVPLPEDAARWQRLGVSENRVRVLGNIKYDASPETASLDPRAILNQLQIDPTRCVLLGGSTHRGEEQILADAFCCLRQKFDDLFLIIAPRHTERAREIESQLRARNLSVMRRTGNAPRANDCLLIDTTGELAHWYAVATVVFIGKSITAHGGQNPVEPILARTPVIFGPNMENFARLAEELIENDGAACVHNQQQLITEADSLLSNPALREKRSAAALRVIAPHHGAVARAVRVIAELL